jgi:hypothetical protein
MDKHARRKQFERLVELREAYRSRGPEDSTSVVSVEVMLRRAQALFERPLPPILMLDESDQKS